MPSLLSALILTIAGVLLQVLGAQFKVEAFGILCMFAGLTLINKKRNHDHPDMIDLLLSMLTFSPKGAGFLLAFIGTLIILLVPAWHIETLGSLCLLLAALFWGSKSLK